MKIPKGLIPFNTVARTNKHRTEYRTNTHRIEVYPRMRHAPQTTQPYPSYIHVPALHAFDPAPTPGSSLNAASKCKPNPTNQTRRLQIKLKSRSLRLPLSLPPSPFFFSWGKSQ